MAKVLSEILSESVNLSEEAQVQITELWESKISEAREEISATLREEFARKFEHDKAVLSESIDRFITDRITAELEEFAIDKRALVAERVQSKQKVAEHIKLLNHFIAETLTKEMSEFRQDKVVMKESFKQLENFLIQQLSEEITEFRADKKALVEQKVRMVEAGRKALAEAKASFIKRASALVESQIKSSLKHELTQLREDIQIARENQLGRKIFEAVAAEYMTSYLSEGTEVSKLNKELANKEAELANLKESFKSTKKLVEGLDVQLKATKDQVERQRVLSELLQPLSKDKKVVMQELLESVKTQDLKGAYTKYLPSVLNERTQPKATQTRLDEGSLKTVTGDRSVTTQGDDIAELERLKKSLAQIVK